MDRRERMQYLQILKIASEPPIISYDQYLWHGTSLTQWKAIRDGAKLSLPLEDAHRSDPGDFGKAVYMTDDSDEALFYSKDTKTHIVRARIKLNKALLLDFKNQKSEAKAWREGKEREWGSTIHGDLRLFDPDLPHEEYRKLEKRKWQDRKIAAQQWRERLLRAGYDGVITRGWDSGEVAVVYRPERSISDYECWEEKDDKLVRIK